MRRRGEWSRRRSRDRRGRFSAGKDTDSNVPEIPWCVNSPMGEATRDKDLPLANPHPHVLVEEPEAVLERKLKLRLMRVVRALEKIVERTCGHCEVTGRPIARARLEQMPEELEVTEVRRRLRMTGGKIRGLP